MKNFLKWDTYPLSKREALPELPTLPFQFIGGHLVWRAPISQILGLPLFIGLELP